MTEEFSIIIFCFKNELELNVLFSLKLCIVRYYFLIRGEQFLLT